MTYCYRKPDGTLIELEMSVGEMRAKQRADGSLVLDDGTIATRDFAAEFGGRRKDIAGNWPMESDAAGCHPSQVQELQKAMADAGCPTEFNSEGFAVFRDRAHRKQALRVMGLHDRDGGYGD